MHSSWRCRGCPVSPRHARGSSHAATGRPADRRSARHRRCARHSGSARGSLPRARRAGPDPSTGTRDRSRDLSSPSPRRTPARRTARAGPARDRGCRDADRRARGGRSRPARAAPARERCHPARARMRVCQACTVSAARPASCADRALPRTTSRIAATASVPVAGGSSRWNAATASPSASSRSGVQPARRRDGVEEIAGRNARHAQHPVDRRSIARIAKAQRTVGAANDRHDVAIQARRRGAVQLQFAQREAPPRLDRGEVEERQPHRLLQLPHRVGADEHQRYVRLQRFRPRETAQEFHHLRLFRRRGHRQVRGTACPASSRRSQPWCTRCGRAAGTACSARTRSARG